MHQCVRLVAIVYNVVPISDVRSSVQGHETLVGSSLGVLVSMGDKWGDLVYQKHREVVD